MNKIEYVMGTAGMRNSANGQQIVPVVFLIGDFSSVGRHISGGCFECR